MMRSGVVCVTPSHPWYFLGNLHWPEKLDKGFNGRKRRTVIFLALFFIEAFAWVIPSTRAATSNWWNTNYAYRAKITVTAGSVNVPTGYTVQVTFNHAGLVSTGKSQAGGDDIRIVYWTGSAWTELDRALNESSSWNGASTKILFKTQAAISASGSDDNYYMYYGYANAANPPANKDNVYLDYDDFESYTVGSAPTGWTVRSGTWIVSNDGGNKVLNATGAGGTKRYIDKDGISVDNVAVRAKVDIVEDPSSQINGGPIARESGTGESDLAAYVVTIVKQPSNDRTELGRLYPGGYGSLASTAETQNIGTWYVVLLTVYSSQQKGYRDGVLKGSATDTNIGSAGRVGLYSYTAANDKRVYFDNFMARKFVNPEPTASLGSEEKPLVGTSTNDLAICLPSQRKSFYANGRFWVFFSDGTNMKFSSSTDAFTWNTPTTIRSCNDGSQFSIWFNGTHASYAYCAQTDNTAIYYRCGSPNSNGTITWSATEQTAVAGASGTTYYWPCICVDSNSRPWIGYRKFPTASSTSSSPMVTKSTKIDGTWTTDTGNGFPKDLAGYTLSYFFAVPVPLTGGKVTCLFTSAGNYVRARSWSGSSWGTDKATSSVIADVYLSAVAQGDEVHTVFLTDDGYAIIKYAKYTYDPTNPSWSSEVNVQGAPGNYVTSTSAPVLSITTQNYDLYCFWASHPTTDHIYYKKCVDGTWDTNPTDWIDESTEHLTSNDLLTCFYSGYSYKIGLVYMTRTSANYNIRFNYLIIPVIPEYPYGLFLVLLICFPICLLARRYRNDKPARAVRVS